MRILVAGSSGYIGTALTVRLRGAGHDIVRLVRRKPARPDEVSWRPDEEDLDPAVVDGAHAAINLAGAGIADRRWTEEYKRLLGSSRINPTATLARAIGLAADPPRVLLNASAVGYYGDRGDAELTEDSPAGQGFFAELCQAWEAATQPAEQAGIRVAQLRTGLVVGPHGGALRPLVRLFRLGLGGRLGSGRQWMPWISIEDELDAIAYLVTAERVRGPVNLTAPEPVRNEEFTRILAAALHRPAVLPVPGAALRLATGDLGTELVASQRILPNVLLSAGYAFRYPQLPPALASALRD